MARARIKKACSGELSEIRRGLNSCCVMRGQDLGHMSSDPSI